MCVESQLRDRLAKLYMLYAFAKYVTVLNRTLSVLSPYATIVQHPRI